MCNEYFLNIDLQMGMLESLEVRFNKEEKLPYKLTFNFTQDKVPVELTNYKMCLIVLTPNFEMVEQEISTINTTTAEIILSNQLTEAVGYYKCIVLLRNIQDDTLMTTPSFKYEIKSSLAERYLTTAQTLTNSTTVISKIQNIVRVDLNTGEIKSTPLILVDTISELMGISNLQVGDIIKVNGFYAAEDGATHIRILSTIDNGTGIAYGSNFLNIVYSNVLISTWFGCKQDGQTDDTINFQRFLSHFGKVNLLVPPGIIRITDTIHIQGIFRGVNSFKNNTAYRRLDFDAASIKWDGPKDACSVQIFCHYKTIISGLNFASYSDYKSNYVNICAVWESKIENFGFDRLCFNENNQANELPYGLTDFEIYYQFNNVFENGTVLRDIKITSTSKDVINKTYMINSLKFKHVVIGSTVYGTSKYNISFYGGVACNNIGFFDCDLSYSTNAVFFIEKAMTGATLSLEHCYLDTAVPLVEDFDFKFLTINLTNCFEASNDSKQMSYFKTKNYMSNSRIGTRGIEANHLPLSILNLAINGDLSYEILSPNWIKYFNLSSIHFKERAYSMHHKALAFEFIGKGAYLHFLVCSYVPITGVYTAGFRIKKIKGAGTVQFNYSDMFYKNYSFDKIPDGEEVTIATYGNGYVELKEGVAPYLQLHSIEERNNLLLELLEIIFIPGTHLTFNLPLHPKAQLISASSTNIDFSSYYTKAEIDNKLNTLSGGISTESYYTKEEVNTNIRNTFAEISAQISSSYYTKSQIDNKLIDIASTGNIDLDNYYTKQEIDNKLLKLPSYYTDKIIYQKPSEIQYMSNVTTLPDIYTKYIICAKQPLAFESIKSSHVISYLKAKIEGSITHSSLENQIKALPELKVIDPNNTYYFTINVTAISETPPTLTLFDISANNASANFTGLTSTIGKQKIACKTPGNRAYTPASILQPKIGITEMDIQSGRYITYEILGVYDNNILPVEQNFIGGIKGSGDIINDSMLGFNAIINEKIAAIPLSFINWVGAQDTLQDNLYYRYIKKVTITPDMIEWLDDSWSNNHIMYYQGISTCPAYVKDLNILSTAVTGSNPALYSKELDFLLYGNESVPINYITLNNNSHFPGRRIRFNILNSELGIKDGDQFTPKEIYEKVKEWIANHPIEITYPSSVPNIEPINFEMPTLLGNKTINSVSFSANTALEIVPILKIQRPCTPYNNLEGKAWLCIGDSITQGQGATLPYPTLANMLIPNCIAYNRGYGGSSICNHNSSGYIVWGKWAEENIDNITVFPEHVDLITIMLGVNDRKSTLILGELSDPPTGNNGSYYSMYKNLIITLMTKYPLAEIVICAPPRMSIYSDEHILNDAGNTFTDVIEATQKIARWFNLRFIDINKEGGVSNLGQLPPTQKRNQWLTPDGLHYNNLAQEMLFRYLVRML